MAKYNITLIPGDGTGPEIAEATRRVIEATGLDIEWDVQDAGVDIMETEGTPLPQRVLDSLRKTKLGIKGPVTTPIGTGFRSVNVALRKELDLYACVRPCKYYEGIRSKYKDVDVTVFRENTEDLYAGVEWNKDTEEADKVIALAGGKIREHSAISIKCFSEYCIRRIMVQAFEYAINNNRKVVTSVAKANIMKSTDGLWYKVTREVAKAYGADFEDPKLEPAQGDPTLADKAGKAKGIIYNERLIDNMCMQLVQKPELYDVICLSNLYGDILSDLCAGLVGGLGVAPGANIGDGIALFEPTHGSAPKYKGMNKVNPAAMMLSGVMMLKYMKEFEAAQLLESSLAEVIAEGKDVTYDMKPDRNDPTAVGTKEFADAIIAKMNSKK